MHEHGISSPVPARRTSQESRARSGHDPRGTKGHNRRGSGGVMRDPSSRASSFLKEMRDDGTPVQNGTDHIQFDPRIAKYRAIVERVIGAMKRWSFLGTGRLLYF